MAAKRDSREALMDAGEKLLREGGYDHAGTNAILDAAGLPRGSFYHHFASKQQFVLEVAERWFDAGSRPLDAILTDEDKPPLARLRAYFEALVAAYRAEPCERGCLVGMLGQELPARDAEARQKLLGLFSRWRHRLADCLREAQLRGELAPGDDADALAEFLIDAWEGALLQRKVQGSHRPLDTFLEVAVRRLLTPA